MVYDKLENLADYAGICENMQTLIDFLAEHDLAELPEGKTEVDGSKVYIKMMTGETLPSEKQDYEVHKLYVDVHVCAEGSELYEVALGETTLVTPYKIADGKELAMVSGPVSGCGTLDPERFVLFLPGEAHKTKVKAAGCDTVRHALIKVLYENEE